MNKIKTIIIGLVTGFFNGLFGAGGGSVLVPCMQRFLKVETHKSHATSIAIILPLTIISAFVYIRGVNLDFSIILWVSVGGVVGGFIGAKVLNKIASKTLHKIFGLFIIAAAIRMII